MMAHLLLAHSPQSLPLAQPDSRLYLLPVSAKPLLGSCPGHLLLEGILACMAQLLHQPRLPPVTHPRTSQRPALPAAYSTLSLATGSSPRPATCPSSLLPMTSPLPAPSSPSQHTSSSDLLCLSPLPLAWPSSGSFPQHIIQLRISLIFENKQNSSLILSPPKASL